MPKKTKPQRRANPFAKWKKSKDLRLGPRSQRVWLLANPEDSKECIVMKQYNRKDKSHRERFDKEVAVLRRLRDCPFVPRLLFVSHSKCALWMSWCGPVASLDAAARKQVELHLQELSSRWGLQRVQGSSHPRFDAASIFPKNICRLGDEVKLIDFGSGAWRLLPRPVHG